MAVTPAPEPPPARGTTRRSVLTGAAALTAATSTAIAAPGIAHAGTATDTATATTANAPRRRGPARPTSSVRVRDGAFQLDGAPFRFGGTNCYYLQHLRGCSPNLARALDYR